MNSYLVVYSLTFQKIHILPYLEYLSERNLLGSANLVGWIIKTPIGSEGVGDGIKERMITQPIKVLVISVPNNDWASFNITKEVTDWMNNTL